MDLYNGHQGIRAAKNLMFLSICYLMLATFTGVNGWTYHYSNNSMNWIKARKWCQAHYTDLVAIQNREENVYLDDFLPKRDKHYWIGIRKTIKWTWVGTKKLLTPGASNWATNEPNNKKSNEDCVEMYVKRGNDTGKWNDESCLRKKTALCYTASCQPDSCSGHGECVEMINSLKCECSQGFHGERCESAVDCEEVNRPSQGFISCSHPFENFSYGSECQFGCEDGYQLVGSGTIQCTASREWSAALPRCEAVQCGELVSPAHGSIGCIHPLGNFRHKAECQFHCEEGYSLTTSGKLLCGPSGQWNGSQPRCEASCQPDSCSGHGECVEMINSLKCECSQGFHGERCESAVDCEEVNRPSQGFISCSHPFENFSYGSECQFGCEDGYQLVGSGTIQCTASREWSAAPPRCEAVQCGELVSPAHGSIGCIHPLGNFRHKAECQFHCEEGYSLTTSGKLLCGPSGQWNGSQPRCEASCQPDSCSGHGECVEMINSLKCECSQGFYGERCESAVDCEEVNRPSQGFISCSHPFENFSYGSECQFGCEDGYQLVGSGTIQCTASREWSAAPPRCEAVQCGELVSPAHGSIGCIHPLGNFRHKAECQFHCEEGYSLTTSGKLLCGPSGQWNGSQPQCEASCQPDSCSGHGECVEMINSLKCECSQGFYGERCESAVDCEEVNRPSQGFISCSHPFGNFSYGSECQFGCEDGYQLIGSGTIQCTASREWSAAPPRCEAVRCSSAQAPQDGSVTCADTAGELHHTAICRFACNAGFTLHGSDVLTCDASGDWVGERPRCRAHPDPTSVGMVTGVVTALTGLSLVALIMKWLHQRTKAKQLDLKSCTDDENPPQVYRNSTDSLI